MNETLNIRLASREMYESNSTDGVWLKLPATAEQLDAALARIGATGGEHGMDYFITGVESPIPALSRLPLENLRRAGIDELNYIAGQFEKIEPAQLDKLSASIDVIAKSGEIHRLAEYSNNTEYFEHLPEVFGFAQLGQHYLDSGRVDMPGEWKDAVDVNKLGQLAAAHEQGIFTAQGYIRPTGDIWETMKELPEEYEIEPKPKKQERKPERAASGRMYDSAARAFAAPIVATPIVLMADNTLDKIKEITDKLEQGVKDIFGSDKYRGYLDTLSKFHNYSSNNCILIAMQRPTASHVAGFNTWRDHFNRHVKKGEKGIKILAPAPYMATKEVDKTTPDGKPVFDGSGQPIKQQIEVKMPAYKVVSVFDVTQTYGEPLPKLGKSELAGNVDNYNDFAAALEKASPVPIGFETIDNGAKGYYDQLEKRIAINKGMSELQNLKTLIHEISHSRLHDKDNNAPEGANLPDSRTREIEAESIAYTVCKHYGLDTSDYSFGYIATWSGDKQIEALKSSLDTIRREANTIITEVDKHFNELQKDRQQTKTQDAEHIAKVGPDVKPEKADTTTTPTTDAPKQHYSTAVQMAVDTSGKAEPPVAAPTAPAKQNEPAPAPKPPAQGENVAAIEAKVNAGETVNLSDLSDAIKKDKQAAQSAQVGKPEKTAKAPAKTAAQTKPQAKGKTAAKSAAPEKPSIREELAASKKQAAARKTAPSKTKNNALEV